MRKATVKASLSRCDCSHKHSNCIEYAQPPSVDVRLILDILYISQVAPLLLLLHPQLDPWSDSDCRGWTWMFSTAGNVVLYSQLHSAVISSIQWCRQSNTQNFENRSAEVADKSIVTLVPCHTCEFVARLWRATLTRDKVSACNFIVARCNFDAACDKQTWLPAIRMTLCQSRSVRLWSRTLRLCRATLVVRQSRATLSQVWHGT